MLLRYLKKKSTEFIILCVARSKYFLNTFDAKYSKAISPIDKTIEITRVLS
eukprot:TRINITY_DN6289_c0_g1_i1.p3 TRINITY_DN6289_c0_g1~~TRINITY_DN6289_c0_g1_i1.p3  ORF type:complete len:51 (+),score=1.71 TRINITY_DN6289_c0_g1_i1:36-188(+)